MIAELEANGLASAAVVHHFEMMRIAETPGSSNDAHLARLGHPSQTVRQPFDNGILVGGEFAQIDLRRSKHDALHRQSIGSVDDGCSVKQGLGRDASDVQADAAKRRPLVDENRCDTEVAGAKRCRVAARTRS